MMGTSVCLSTLDSLLSIMKALTPWLLVELIGMWQSALVVVPSLTIKACVRKTLSSL